MKNDLYPKPTKSRITGIDILRGVALFGILLVNILGFNASFFNFGGFYNSLPDEFQRSFYNVYISLTADKFIFLFSFLFGYGIFMQYYKFINNQEKFNGFFVRRMAVLAAFGIIHIVFLWAGDILLIYAIAGFIILLFYRLKTKWLFPLAFLFYFFIAIWLLVDIWIDLPNAMSSTCPECLENAKLIYTENNYYECLKLRIIEYYSFRNINAYYYLPKVIGIVLMGFIASKHDLYNNIISNRTKWTITFLLMTVVSTIIYFGYEKIVDFDSPYANAVYMFGYEMMNLFIALTYMLFIILIVSFNPIAKALKPVADMGRMSLTNYIAQSIILSIIFYGWGLGYFGQTNVVNLVILAVCVYVFQIVISSIWLRYFKQGPLEMIWRKICYSGFYSNIS